MLKSVSVCVGTSHVGIVYYHNNPYIILIDIWKPVSAGVGSSYIHIRLSSSGLAALLMKSY